MRRPAFPRRAPRPGSRRSPRSAARFRDPDAGLHDGQSDDRGDAGVRNPVVRPTAKLPSSGGTAFVEVPLVWRTTPFIKAFTASVATSGVIVNRVIAMPATRPEACRASAMTPSTGEQRVVARPVFRDEHRGSEMTPAPRGRAALLDHQRLSDRSDRQDRCERQLESNALWPTLPDASSGLTANSSPVATRSPRSAEPAPKPVARLRRGTREPRRWEELTRPRQPSATGRTIHHRR